MSALRTAMELVRTWKELVVSDHTPVKEQVDEDGDMAKTRNVARARNKLAEAAKELPGEGPLAWFQETTHTWLTLAELVLEEVTSERVGRSLAAMEAADEGMRKLTFEGDQTFAEVPG